MIKAFLRGNVLVQALRASSGGLNLVVRLEIRPRMIVSVLIRSSGREVASDGETSSKVLSNPLEEFSTVAATALVLHLIIYVQLIIALDFTNLAVEVDGTQDPLPLLSTDTDGFRRHGA